MENFVTESAENRCDEKEIPEEIKKVEGQEVRIVMRNS